MDNAHAEIAGIVEITVASICRRWRCARVIERAELVNEAWLVALEALPAARARAADLGGYLGTTIARNLTHALRRWGREPATDQLPDVADPAPRADDVIAARQIGARAFDALDEVDRAIAAALVGIGGRRASEPREVARALSVPVGRVYQARQNLARRALGRRTTEPAQLTVARMGGA
jgi:hypothetical protein